MGALCSVENGEAARATLLANVTAADGEEMIVVSLEAERGESAKSLGTRMAQALASRGARDLLTLGERSEARLDALLSVS